MGATLKHSPVLSKVFLLLRVCQLSSLIGLISILLNEYSRPPFQCLMNPYVKAVETYCFIQSTFTYQRLSGSSQIYDSYPGVGPTLEHNGGTKAHKYFFWIPFFLTFQIFLFGFPQYLWNCFEGQLIQHLLESESKKKINQSSKYFVATLHHHKARALLFLSSEALGVVILVANLFLTNWFLEGRFLFSVPEIFANILTLDEVDGIYDRIFPKMTKCSFHLYGSSGSLVKKDVLCVMARNMLTGRIYTLHFLVFSTAAAMATFALCLRVSIYFSAHIRQFTLLRKVSILGMNSDLRFILRFCDYGDWFLVYQLACNMKHFSSWLGFTSKELQELNKRALCQTLQGE